jgi:hypothetical protein
MTRFPSKTAWSRSTSYSSKPRPTQAYLGSRTLTTPHAREFARAISCLRSFLGEHISPDNFEVFYEMAFLARRKHWHPLFSAIAHRAVLGFPTPFRLPANITDSTAAEMGLDHLVTVVHQPKAPPTRQGH